MLQVTKVKGIFLFIFLAFMLAVPSVYAVTVPVDNYSFENAAGSFDWRYIAGYGSLTVDGMDAWNYDGLTGRSWQVWGIYTAKPTQYSDPLSDGNFIGHLANGSIYQDTGWLIEANNEFTLMIDIGRRYDYGFPGSYAVELLGGENLLVSDGSIVPGQGSFSTLMLSYTVLENDINIGSTLGIRIFADGNQLNFDNIRLTNDSIAASVPEPGTMVLLGFGLLGLAGFQRSRRIKN